MLKLSITRYLPIGSYFRIFIVSRLLLVFIHGFMRGLGSLLHDILIVFPIKRSNQRFLSHLSKVKRGLHRDRKNFWELYTVFSQKLIECFLQLCNKKSKLSNCSSMYTEAHLNFHKNYWYRNMDGRNSTLHWRNQRSHDCESAQSIS